jgi:hypothetical protein
MNIIKKNTEVLFDASNKVYIEVNTEISKYTVMFHHQTAGQNHYTKVSNKSLKNVANSKYMETMETNQNYIDEEINSRLNLGDVCYHEVQNLLSSYLLSKNTKIKINKTVILPIVLY